MTDLKTPYTFGSVSTEKLIDDVEKLFGDVEEWSSEQFYICKEVSTCYLDDKEIKYHLVINVIDLENYGCDGDTKYSISMNVVPTLESLSEKSKENILDPFVKGDRQYYIDNPDSLIPDIMSYGYSIPIDSETCIDDDNKLDIIIKTAMSVAGTYSDLIGFYLDKQVNIIGNTGWDFLAEYCNDLDTVKAAIDRFKNSKND
jgi:hypothetical protein